MTTYRQHFSTRVTPQSEPIPTMDMIRNDAGGYVFAVDDWKRLDRFLILGSEGGSYYVGEQKLTIDNAQAVMRCVQEDGLRVVNRIVEISDSGRAVKNDPALFALAMCSAADSVEVRRSALAALPKVARIGTHLFHFTEYVEGFRGWGRALRRAVANWYNEMPLDKLAYQVVKYQQRDGWSHRDLLRLAHPKVADSPRNDLYKYIVKGNEFISVSPASIIDGFELAKQFEGKSGIIKLIDQYGLTREMIPTEWLNEPDVWEALLQKMPLTALIRNLGKMTSVGLLQPMSNNTQLVTTKLLDQEYIRKSRLHPLSVLVALKVYSQGHGIRGSLEWFPVREIVDALDEAFYLAFGNVRPTGKRMMLALDVSGSMTWQNISGMPITPAEAAAAMALVTARIEPSYWLTAFSGRMVDINISPRQRLDDVIRTIEDISFGSTDCALPMLEALERNIPIDVFSIFTDNETWAGSIHPTQALTQYREKMGIASKLVTIGMTSSGFSIADLNDPFQLDIIGFDTATPQVISNFSIE